MNKTHIISASCIGILLSVTFVGNLFGGAFDNPGIGLRGQVMGYTLTGIADDSSAVYYNPGGLALNEKNTLNAEVYTYYAGSRIRYAENSNSYESDEIFIVPGLFISKTYDNWAFGFGHYTPYAGGGTVYDDYVDPLSPYVYDRKLSAGFAAFTPAAAYKLRPNLSVGIGLSLYVGGLGSKIFNPYIPEPAVMRSKYDGLAGFGGHIGFMYKPAKEWNVGFIARSKIAIEMDGDVKVAGVKYDSEVELEFPYSFELGLGYKPNENIMLGLTICYKLWGHSDNIRFKTEDPFDTVKIPTYYKNSWLIGIGMERDITSDLSVMAGFKYVESATEDEKLDLGTNDVDLLTPCVGVAYDITDAIEINALGVYLYGLKEEYDSKKYDYDMLVLTLGLRFKY